MQLPGWPIARSGAGRQCDWAAVSPDRNQLRGPEPPPPVGYVRWISSEVKLSGLCHEMLGSLCHTAHESLPAARPESQPGLSDVLSREALRIPGLRLGRVGWPFS